MHCGLTRGESSQGQRKPWASPLGAEASTPGALLYHDRAPASPLNMMLLNRQPAQQSTPANKAQAHAADPPSPPRQPAHPSAQQNGVAGRAQPERHAEAADGAVEALPAPQGSVVAARIAIDGNAQHTKQTVLSAKEQATQASVEAKVGAAGAPAPAGTVNATEAQQHASPTQPPPARKPKGKGFLGAEILVNQQAPPEKAQGNPTPNQPAEHQNSPLENAASRSALAPEKPGADKGADSSLAQAGAGQQGEAAPEQHHEPAISNHCKQSTQTREVEASRQSPDLEIASVHQAVEAVQVRPPSVFAPRLDPPHSAKE